MSCLHYHETELFIEKVKLKNIAHEFGTPCYVYSRAAIEANWRQFDEAFRKLPHRICYAVKANSNLAILQILARLSSGFDIVSIGEAKRILAAGGRAEQIVFSGIGKTEDEITQAIKMKIHCFNIESEAELERIQTIAASMQQTVNIALRINPNIDPQTHTHITTGLHESKFGIAINNIIPLAKKIIKQPSLRLIGIAAHIGSQITQLSPFLKLIDSLVKINSELRKNNIKISHINIGGGLGIKYHNENPPSIETYASALQEKLAGEAAEIIIEPGRSIVGNAGVLLTQIEYLKHTPHKNFVIIDAGMNDLLRPALYDAWQNVLPVSLRSKATIQYDIAGPVCESADFLGKNRELAVEAGDLLAIDSAGAYGFSMSSNYNSRCRPAEVLVSGESATLIRRRETIEDLYALEQILPS